MSVARMLLRVDAWVKLMVAVSRFSISPVSPLGIVKSKTAAPEVPLFVTFACVPGSPVVTVPTVIVAAVPVAPVAPVAPLMFPFFVQLPEDF